MKVIRPISALAWRQRVTLDGVPYDLRLSWCERLSAWYADLFATNGEAIFAGARVSKGWPIGWLSRVARGTAPAGPPGMLLAVDTSERGRTLDSTAFGDGISLVYLEEDDLVEAPLVDPSVFVRDVLIKGA